MKKRIVSLLLAFVLLIGCLPLSAGAASVTTDAVSSLVSVAQRANGKLPGDLGLPTSSWCGRFVGYCINNSSIASQLGTISSGDSGLAIAPINWICAKKDAGHFYVFSEPHRNRLLQIYPNLSGKMTLLTKSAYTPQVGDIVEFTWDSWSKHSFSHVGIVTGVNGNTITYIDGNSTSGKGKVATHTTSKSSNTVYGFIRFNTSGSTPPPTPTPTPSPTPNDPTLSQGSKGAKVREMQQLLKNAGEILDVDGDFGPKTRNAVINFQRKAGLVPDGICGPNTWAALRARGQKTSAPYVSVNGQTVNVSWSFSGSAPGGVDVYLLQEPWGWYDIKYSAHTTNSGYTFYNVQPGYYRAFTIVRPNADNVQSVWSELTVQKPHTTHSWGDGTVTKPSTEEEEGIMTYTCKECGATKTETIIKLPHIEHRWDEGVVVKEPTETEPGLKVYTCTSPVCNETMEEEIPPLNGDTPLDPTPENDFIDVPNGAYFAKAVNWAVENNITAGTGKTTFSPNQTCTRAQAVTFLWRYAGSPKPAVSSSKFIDVAPGQYYTDAVLWAVEKGITGGVSTTRFAPDDKCTRAQIVSFLHRMNGSPSVSGVSPFLDVPPSLYYANSVAWAVEKGITMGTSTTLFSPHNDCSRGQIVTFLYRYAG